MGKGGGFRTSVGMIKQAGQGNVGKVMKIMSRPRQPTTLHACTTEIGDVQRTSGTLNKRLRKMRDAISRGVLRVTALFQGKISGGETRAGWGGREEREGGRGGEKILTLKSLVSR